MYTHFKYKSKVYYPFFLHFEKESFNGNYLFGETLECNMNKYGDILRSAYLHIQLKINNSMFNNVDELLYTRYHIKDIIVFLDENKIQLVDYIIDTLNILWTNENIYYITELLLDEFINNLPNFYSSDITENDIQISIYDDFFLWNLYKLFHLHEFINITDSMNKYIISWDSSREEKRNILNDFNQLEIFQLMDRKRRNYFREDFELHLIKNMKLYIAGKLISFYNDISYFNYIKLYSKYNKHKFKDIIEIFEDYNILNLYLPILFFDKLNIPLLNLKFSEITIILDLHDKNNILLEETEINDQLSIDEINLITLNSYLLDEEREYLSLKEIIIAFPFFEIFEIIDSSSDFMISNLEFQYPSKYIIWGIWDPKKKKFYNIDFYKSSELSINNTKISKELSYFFYLQKYQYEFQQHDSLLYNFDVPLLFYKFKSKYLFFEYNNFINPNIYILSEGINYIKIFQGYII